MAIEKITLDVNEVAKMLGVSSETIYKMVREGLIPNFRVRNKIMFNKDLIIAWTRGEYQLETVNS